ncbi:MAG: hypothetical protein QOJ32_2058, partial [Frankiaceae bacterium]|nr:hypothetical protein [Frankiaceae bacterium]
MLRLLRTVIVGSAVKRKFTGSARAAAVAGLSALTALLGLPLLAGPAAAAGNGALLLNGAGQYASMGVAPAIGLKTFTIETRFRRDAAGVTTSTGVGGVTDAVPLLTKGRWEDDGSNVDSNWFLGLSASRGVLVADFEGAGTDYGDNHPVYGTTAVTSGVWHSAAATYDGTTWRLYLDGKLDGTLAVGVTPRWDSIQWASIGSALNSAGTAEGSFAGAVDEARVWNYARSATDVAANVSAAIVNAPGLVGRWSLDETSGTTAADSSGSGLTANLVGGPTHVAAPDLQPPASVPAGPTAPTGLTATAGDSRVDLSWTASSDPSVVGYQVYRSSSLPVATAGRPANPSLVTGTTYLDPNVVNGTASSYAVVAVASTGATSPASTPATATPKASGDPVLVGAGDIAACDGTGDDQTAAVLDKTPGTVFTLGDNAYQDGTAAEFANCYDPTWGRAKVRTHPLPGNHDYQTAGATGYYGYFGAAAGDPAKGWYSYDLGRWHIVVLNSECSEIGGCGAGSPEEVWLKSDLAAHASSNILALWHEPRWDSVTAYTAPDTRSQAFWNDLYAAGADLVLNGHSHLYERFAPQTPTGVRDDARGLTQITVGSGGENHHAFSGAAAPNSLVHNSDTYGVLKLTLRPTSYSYQFLPVAGSTFTDSGTVATHSAAPAVPAAASAVTAAPTSAGIDLGWTSSEPSSTGFTVDRAASAAGPWTRLTATPVKGRSWTDSTAPLGVTSYYSVRAVTTAGQQSVAAIASARRNFAMRGSTTTSIAAARTLTVARPAGVVAGDVMVATVSAYGVPSLIAPSGWTLVRSDVRGTVLTTWTYYRVAGSAEPTSTTWTFGTATSAVIGVTGITGVDRTAPVLTSAGRNAAWASTITA